MPGSKINIYHVCTRGLAKALWFYDEQDFKSGMNAIQVCAVLTGVDVYCFCLMDNHVHFILRKARYKDSELRVSLDSISAEKFRGQEYSGLKIENRYFAARELRKRYGAGPRQIARVSGLDYENLKMML